MDPDLRERIVIQSRAAQSFVLDVEAERLHEVQCAAGIGAQADHVAGFGGNLRLEEHHIEHSRTR